MKITLRLLVALFALSSTTFAQGVLIPQPVSYQQTDAMFMLDDYVAIDIRTDNSEVRQLAEQLVTLAKKSGTNLTYKSVPQPSQQQKAIIFELNKTPNAELGAEGYELDVNNESIRVVANQPAGIFYALQTFRQLLPTDYERKDDMVGIGMLMGCKIKDYPRFGWRGLMLDVSRHFFTKEEVKQYIDVMANYKFNTLHWHLTDDNGWRVEIKSYPKLTEVGAWRVERFGRFGDRKDPQPNEPTTYGGFYTQEDIKEIVAYAAKQHITIVPEIDVPGHSMAALAAYPELSTRKEPKSVNPGTNFAEWYGDGKFKMLIENTLNPADEKVYTFLDKVFGEIATLFPAQYIHVGGDECYHGYWAEDEGCKKLMKKEGLKDTHELQSYFMKRVEKIVSSKGKKMIGWDEILEGGLAKGAAVMSWRGMKGGIEAAKMGHEVVMTPTTYAYLDYTQGDHTVELPIYADLSLHKTYDFEPIPDGVEAKYILGGQGNLWTEQVPTLRHAFYMTYPRAFALAETFWSPKEKKEWNGFVGRVENHFSRFEAQDLAVSHAIYDPIVKTSKEGDKLICTITSDVQNTEIFYTLDNSFPDKFTPKYEKPISIPEGDVTLKVVTYRNGRPMGRMLAIKRTDLEKRVGR